MMEKNSPDQENEPDENAPTEYEWTAAEIRRNGRFWILLGIGFILFALFYAKQHVDWVAQDPVTVHSIDDLDGGGALGWVPPEPKSAMEKRWPWAHLAFFVLGLVALGIGRESLKVAKVKAAEEEAPTLD